MNQEERKRQTRKGRFGLFWECFSGTFIDRELFAGSHPVVGAVLHDNLAAIDRFLDWRVKSGCGDSAMVGYSPQGPIHYGTIRYVGRRSTFSLSNSGRVCDLLYICTNMGAPNAPIVVHELHARAQVQQIIKVATASGLRKGIEQGQILVPHCAIEDEGTSKWNDYEYALDESAPTVQIDEYFKEKQLWKASPRLRDRLLSQMGLASEADSGTGTRPLVAVWSVDSYPTFIICHDLYHKLYECEQVVNVDQQAVDVLGVEMECAALLSAAALVGMQAAALVVVSRSQEEMKMPAEGEEYKRSGPQVRNAELWCMEVATRTLLENAESILRGQVVA